MPSVRADTPARIAALVLAAGRSRRFGRRHKLLAPFAGQPLWWHVLAAACASRARPVIVVLGHRPRQMRASLAAFRAGLRRSLRLHVVHNLAYKKGLSTSLRAGLAALPADCAGAVVCLADMPRLSSRLINALIAAHQPGDAAVMPIAEGQRGNPVLLGRSLFPAVVKLRGDQGARRLLTSAVPLREVIADASAILDFDTRRDWHSARLRLPLRRRPFPR